MSAPKDKMFKKSFEGCKWYQAIECSNCAEVMQLLRNDGTRLQKTGYEGRTALHAAVIGGWGEAVVEEVLSICKSGHGSASSLWHGSASSSSQQSGIALRDLLDARDEEYDQTALTMAVIIGNGKVVRAIMRAYASDDRHDDVRDDEDEINEVWQQRRSKERLVEQRKHQLEEQRQQDDEQQRQQLRDIMPAIIQKYSESPEYTELLKYHCRQVTQYRNELQEYVLHSICYTDKDHIRKYIEVTYADDSCEPEVKILQSIANRDRLISEFEDMQSNMMQSIVEEAKKITEPSLVPFLFKLQDNCGMTPLHAAVRLDQRWKVRKVLELIPNGSADCVNAPDGAGRTPLHRAAAEWWGHFSLDILLEDTRTDVNTRFYPCRSFEGLVEMREVRKLLTPNEAEAEAESKYELELTALHLAILHSNSHAVKKILNHKHVQHQTCVRRPFYLDDTRSGPGDIERDAGTPLNLAIVMGDQDIIRVLLQDDKVYDNGRIQNKSPPPSYNFFDEDGPALHIAACCGYPEIVTMILDNNNFDPMVIDRKHNTALHYATDAFRIDRAKFHSIQNYVDLETLHYSTIRTLSPVSKGYSGKRGCINLLLQAGLNIWSKGMAGNTPTPGLLATEEDRAWWHEKVDNVTMEMKKNLMDAANAISVTAALVATASFVGPLQPPTGYHYDAMYIYYELPSIKIFIVCDSLSFYFAVAAIVLSVIPSLPLLQAPLRRELDWTHRNVIMAVCLLLMSIIFVLLSFAAATIAVLPKNWSHRRSIVSIVVLGGAICLMVLYLFTLRLVRLVFYRNLYIRHSYDGLAKHLLLYEVFKGFKKFVKQKIRMMCAREH